MRHPGGCEASPVVAGAGELSIVFALVDGVEEDLGLFIPHDKHGRHAGAQPGAARAASDAIAADEVS